MSEADQPNREPVLPPEASRTLDTMGSADLVVGIPALDAEATVGRVVTAVEAGLRKHFPELRAVICVSDGGSTDRTMAQARAGGVGNRAEALLVPPSSPVPAKLVFRYGGLPGKGSALRAVFETARRLEARWCAVLDADLRSITPYWVDRLLAPAIHHGYEFVAPRYVRHRHDGTITNSVAYPLTTALYGVRIRQPIGGEFAMSGSLAAKFSEAEVWESDVARFGVDLWMTTRAIVDGRMVCQSILGAKLHDPKDPGQSLGPMFRQVVGTLFTLAERHATYWREVEGVTMPPTFGFPSAVVAEPVEVTLPVLRTRHAEGREEWGPLWGRVLSAEVLPAALDGALDAATWVSVLYDYLTAWVEGGDRRALIDSLLPLYFARTATHVGLTLASGFEESEAAVEAVVDAALEQKARLRERWPAPAAAV